MRVLLATDGSSDAQTAAEWLKRFPLPVDSQALTLSIAAPPHPPVDAQTMAEVRGAVVDDARHNAEDARKVLAARWPSAEARVSDGEPREDILRIAEEWAADLIVVGERGLGAVAGFLLGSVSLAVARHASCAVLVAKGGPREVRSAIVALDGSEPSLQAFRFFASLALPRDLSVRLVAVVEKLRFPSTAPRSLRGHLMAALDRLHAERRAELEGLLGRMTGELSGKVKTVEQAVPLGIPSEEIVHAANTGVDLVVVGARGLGSVQRVLLGSVSEKVLRHAQCPVLIVKQPR